MKKTILSFLMAVVMSLGICSTSLAAQVEPGVIGFVNMQVVLNSYPGIKNIAQQISDKQVALQKDFDTQSKDMEMDAKLELQSKLNQELAAFEDTKMAPVKKRIDKTIKKVAAAKGIKSVVNINAMISGGEDLTDEVVAGLK